MHGAEVLAVPRLHSTDLLVRYLNRWRPGGGDDEHYVYAIAI